MTDKNRRYIKMMKDIFNVSSKIGVKAFIWGGFAIDILNGEFTRDHGDLDCFAENLVDNIEIMKNEYEVLGYTVNYLEDLWMLQIQKGDIHATFNSVRNVDGIAHWYHAGRHGTVFFPFEWLDKNPRLFYGSPVYTAGVTLTYTLKTNVQLLSPEWKMREKDKLDIEILERLLISENINKDNILKSVWSHNPYWYAKGYDKYYYPILLV